MYDELLVREILHQIETALHTILQRFKPVKTPADFTNSPEGMEKLDSICMLLAAIGESLKKIDKITNKSLLSRYPQVNWKRVKGLRDIISHHYFDINAEAIFDVCETKVKILEDTIHMILDDFNPGVG